MPNEENLTIEDKHYIFAIRNRMIQIPTNFPSKYENKNENCLICGKKEIMEHLYSCKWDQKNNETKYENIFGNNVKKMKKVYNQFRQKYENREKHINHPRDPNSDPLFSLYEYSNGNITN